MGAQRLLYRPAEAADAIGISRTKAYELIATGVIPSIRIGTSIRVPVSALQEWIERQLADRAADSAGARAREVHDSGTKGA
jgi:excisionase family DNA binding protein